MNAQPALVFDPATGSYYQVPQYGMAQQYPYGYYPVQMGQYPMVPVFVQSVPQPLYSEPFYCSSYNEEQYYDSYEESYYDSSTGNISSIDLPLVQPEKDIAINIAVPMSQKTSATHLSVKVEEVRSFKEVLFSPTKEPEKSIRVKPVIQVVPLKDIPSQKKVIEKKFVKKTHSIDKDKILKDRKEFIDILLSISSSFSEEINRHPINLFKRMSEEDFKRYFKFFFRTEKDYSFWNRFKTCPPLDEVIEKIPFWMDLTCKHPRQACFHVKGLKL
jgi:hypothetical protein